MNASLIARVAIHFVVVQSVEFNCSTMKQCKVLGKLNITKVCAVRNEIKM